MGAFYLVSESDPLRRARLAESLESALRDQGFDEPLRVEGASFAAAAFGKLNGSPPQTHVAQDGGFTLLSGTAIVGGAVGAGAARMLAGAGTNGPARALGAFCAVRGDAREVRLETDPLGVYKVYTDVAERVFCSSFLALARALGPLTANAQGVYEYVHQEATYGRDTVVAQIRLARCRGHYRIGGESHFEPHADGWRPQVEDGPVEAHHEACLTRLREEYRAIAGAFGDAVDTALSGGYDSRLTLALLREQGVSPSIHVYGSEDSADVHVARRIAESEDFTLQHVDKGRLPRPQPDEFFEIVRRNYLAFDGWPSAGIFDGGADLDTRRARGAGARLMLNGGGGEIFRNFFYLLDRPLSARELVWSFYNRYAPSWGTAAFDERAYVEVLADKIVTAIGAGSRHLSRAEVEYVYPVFRCGFWMGRNNSVNNRLGWALTPFIDDALVRRAVAVPLRYKNHGRFEAALIRGVSPTLAGYASDYGHAFDADPPLSRIAKDYATLLRPPWLRRLSYRIRHRHPVPRPPLLGPDWLGRVVDPALPRLQSLFHVERVNDPAMYGRLATLEYLFADLGVKAG